MKRASKILITVSAFYSIFLTLVFLGIAITFFVLASPACADLIRQGLENGTIRSSFTGDTETVIAAIQLMLSAFGGVMIFVMACAIANTVISFIAMNKPIITTSMAAILGVFGILSGTYFGLVGGILGAVADRHAN